MTMALRGCCFAIVGALAVCAAIGEEPSPSGAMPKAEAIKNLDAVFARIIKETLDASGDTDVYGVERSGSKGQPTEVTEVSVSPESWLGCGCCGDGPGKANFSDDDMALLAPLNGIRKLTINRSKITDRGMRYLTGLTQLEELDLSENGITDEGLKYLASCEKLQILRLMETKITGSGLAASCEDDTAPHASSR